MSANPNDFPETLASEGDGQSSEEQREPEDPPERLGTQDSDDQRRRERQADRQRIRRADAQARRQASVGRAIDAQLRTLQAREAAGQRETQRGADRMADESAGDASERPPPDAAASAAATEAQNQLATGRAPFEQQGTGGTDENPPQPAASGTGEVGLAARGGGVDEPTEQTVADPTARADTTFRAAAAEGAPEAERDLGVTTTRGGDFTGSRSVETDAPLPEDRRPADTTGPAATFERGVDFAEGVAENPERAAIAGLPLAAAEPTPAGEVVVGGLLAAGAITAADRSGAEIPIPDDPGLTPTEIGTGVGSLFPEEIREPQGPATTITQPELPASEGAGPPTQDVGVGRGDPTAGPELPLSVGEGAAPTVAGEETVVPEDFPLPGRDLPARPGDEFIAPERRPTRTQAGQQLGRGIGEGIGTGESITDRARERTGPSEEELAEILSGSGTLGEIDDDPTGPRVRREFPTGGSAVVGRGTEASTQLGRRLIEQAQEPQATVGGSGRVPDPSPALAAAAGTATGLADRVRVRPIGETGVDEVPATTTTTAVETATASETEPIAATATDVATEPAFEQPPAVASQPGFETPPVAEQAFPTEPGVGTGTGPATGPGTRSRSDPDFGDGDDDPMGEDDPFGDEFVTFENPIPEDPIGEVDQLVEEGFDVL